MLPIALVGLAYRGTANARVVDDPRNCEPVRVADTAERAPELARERLPAARTASDPTEPPLDDAVDAASGALDRRGERARR